jgi:hypothetical protein
MSHWIAWIAASLLALALAGYAQAQPGSPAVALPAATVAPEATQFDFLIGHWELEVVPKVSGLAAALHGAPRLVGSWKAWRAFDGRGVSDELRVVDASGNPVSLTHAQRIYDPKAQHWLVQGLDVYRARFASSTATWKGGEMLASGSGTAPDGTPVLTRTRFFDIGAERFRMRQDRSSDNGASWDEGVLSLTAKRVARVAPR